MKSWKTNIKNTLYLCCFCINLKIEYEIIAIQKYILKL